MIIIQVFTGDSSKRKAEAIARNAKKLLQELARTDRRRILILAGGGCCMDVDMTGDPAKPLLYINHAGDGSQLRDIVTTLLKPLKLRMFLAAEGRYIPAPED